VLHFGNKALQEKVCRPCLMGEKVICLAITEPSAGSDVANLKTTAKLTPDGKHYIVNGEKKWITNGVFADYFTVAVRTGGPGAGGVSMLLIERSEGIKTTQMKCSGVWPSGTTYITFEDVKVPVENLIGKENEGFKYIMYNFNHERWGVCVQALRFARVCVEESMRYAFKRKTFGKALIEHLTQVAQIQKLVEASSGYDIPPFSSVFDDITTWRTVEPPRGTVYNYPVRPHHNATPNIAYAPAPAEIAVQMYNQGIQAKMIARMVQNNEPIDGVLRWAEQEVEGFKRG